MSAYVVVGLLDVTAEQVRVSYSQDSDGPVASVYIGTQVQVSARGVDPAVLRALAAACTELAAWRERQAVKAVAA